MIDKQNNPLKNAPHTLSDIINWDKPYSIELGCFPTPEVKQNKIFPSANRIDDVYGDRNFLCSCFDFEQNSEHNAIENQMNGNLEVKETGEMINSSNLVHDSSLNEAL